MTPQTNSIGVKLIAKGIDPKVDIIAVHGLHGDAYRTWTAKPETPDGQEVLWLRDLLPAEVPNARILAYGYDSDPGKVFESISTNMIHHHATTLVSEVHFYRRREHERRRPIIFVCHSLGGIVVKRALIYSNTCNLSHNVHLRSIKVSTYGILFLGTPHMGADLARWGKMAEMLVRLVSPSSFVDSNNALVKALEKNSETLQNITESFLGISRDFRIFFFWEELKTSIAGMGRELIVDYSSAVPEAYPDAGRAAIHATHSDMCKFHDENSPGWNVLAGCLCDFVEHAPSVIERSWAQEQRRNVLETQGYLDNVIRNTQARMSSPHLLPSSRTSSPSGVGRITGGNDPLQPDEISEFGDFSNYGSRNASHNRLIKNTPFVKPLSLQENKYFEGREDELNTIHAILTDPDKKAVTISSVTGGGKTHLVREYFFHRKSEFPGGAFWIDCKPMKSALSTESLDLGYCMIAEELGLDSQEHLAGSKRSQKNVDPKVTTRLEVRNWFDKHDGWLLVLDGANVETNDEVNLLSEYVPKSKGGCIILTTLNWSFAGAARLGSPEPLELGRPTDEEAVRMVLHYAQIKSPSETEVEASRKLVEHLERNPLAIQSAGSYIKGKKVSVSDYLRKYEKQPFVEREFLEPFHDIFDRLDARTDRYGEAGNLLRLMAFLHREIPVQMLEFGVRHLPREIKLRAKDASRRDLNNTIGHLLAYSLVDRTGRQSENVQIDTLVLHSVVQEVCISRLRREPGELKRWLELAILMYCSSFDAMELRQNNMRFLVSDYRRYELHGVRLLEHARKHKVGTGDLQRVMEKLGDAIRMDDQLEGPRLSMFASGSGSDSASETPSPETSRRSTWDDKHRTTSEPAQFVQSGGAQASLWKVQRLLAEDTSYDSDSEYTIVREPVKRSRRRHRPRPQRGDKPYKYRYEPPWVPRHGQASAYSKPQDPHLFTEDVTHSPQFNFGDTNDPRSPVPGTEQTPVSTSSRAILQALLRRPSGFSSMDPSTQQSKWPWIFSSSRPRTPLRSVSPTPPDTISQGLQSRTSTFPVSIIPPGTYSRGRSPIRRGRERESLPNIHQPTAQGSIPRAEHDLRTFSYDSASFPHLITTDHDAPPFGGSGDPFGYPQRITTPTNYQGKGGILDMPSEPLYSEATSKPRPFSPGFSPGRDLSSSPIARSIVGPRFDRPPSGAWSEPILEHDGDFSPQPSSYGSINMMKVRPSTATGEKKSPRIAQLQALAPRGAGGRYSEPMPRQRSGSAARTSPEPSAHPMHRVVSAPSKIPITGPEPGASPPGLEIKGLYFPFGSIPEVTIAPHTPDHMVSDGSFGGGILAEAGGLLRGEDRLPERRSSVPEASLEEIESADMQRSTSEPSYVTGVGLRRRSPGREHKIHND